MSCFQKAWIDVFWTAFFVFCVAYRVLCTQCEGDGLLLHAISPTRDNNRSCYILVVSLISAPGQVCLAHCCSPPQLSSPHHAGQVYQGQMEPVIFHTTKPILLNHKLHTVSQDSFIGDTNGCSLIHCLVSQHQSMIMAHLKSQLVSLLGVLG